MLQRGIRSCLNAVFCFSSNRPRKMTKQSFKLYMFVYFSSNRYWKMTSKKLTVIRRTEPGLSAHSLPTVKTVDRRFHTWYQLHIFAWFLDYKWWPCPDRYYCISRANVTESLIKNHFWVKSERLIRIMFYDIAGYILSKENNTYLVFC